MEHGENVSVKDLVELDKWPPDYTVKAHPRAKHVKFKVSQRYGLEIVTPKRFNKNEIPELLEKHKTWITKQLVQLAQVKESPPDQTLPNEVSLLGINQVWKIDYIKMESKRLQLAERPDYSLVVYGKLDRKLVINSLLNWTKRKALEYLALELDALCRVTNFTYENLTIRAQRGRWGSCTNKKSLSLNFKLLFLPRNLMQHVLLHELCHTIHMNHSERFWKLVAKFDTAWQEHEKLLKNSEHWIPSWVE